MPSPTLDDAVLLRLLPGKVGALLRDRARGIDERGLETQVERISISTEETFERDIDDREQLHAELRRMAGRLAEHLVRTGQAGRTITTKVRYPDFAIRSRSSTVAAGLDDGGAIGDIACALLDRALSDRPGPLRLVGVGVSNSSRSGSWPCTSQEAGGAAAPAAARSPRPRARPPPSGVRAIPAQTRPSPRTARGRALRRTERR